MTAMPGKSHTGPLPPLTDEQKALASRLRRHVEALARTERNTDLETPARYIAAALTSHGVTPVTQDFPSGGRIVRNVEVSPPGASFIVVGAHYDTVPGSPGADDNASAVAALIELAGLVGKEGLPIRFVAFANEEMPYFLSPEMGSWNSARRSRERGETVRAMLSLEMLGYYRDEPGTQRYPPPLGLLYPDRGTSSPSSATSAPAPWFTKPFAPSASTPLFPPKASPHPPSFPASPSRTTGPSAPTASRPSWSPTPPSTAILITTCRATPLRSSTTNASLA
jgi:hypothetical protein